MHFPQKYGNDVLALVACQPSLLLARIHADARAADNLSPPYILKTVPVRLL